MSERTASWPPRETLVQGRPTYGEVTRVIAAPLERPATRAWWAAFLLSSTALILGISLVAYTMKVGIGVWGLNRTVGWGFDITNFVFWVGIGHAGTLISAILFLMRQRWRTAINRFAEAMTIVAVICALMFPAIHVGRIWVLHWFFPVPNQMSMWPNFRSPLPVSYTHLTLPTNREV